MWSEININPSLGNNMSSTIGFKTVKTTDLIFSKKRKLASRFIKTNAVKAATKSLTRAEDPCLKSGGGVCAKDTFYSVANRGPSSSTLSIASPQPLTTQVNGSSAK